MIERLRRDDSGQLSGMDLPGVIIGVGIAIVSAIVVIFVGSRVLESAALEPDNASKAGWQGDPLYNASESVRSGANDAFALLGPVFIIVMAAVAIAYLRMTRR